MAVEKRGEEWGETNARRRQTRAQAGTSAKRCLHRRPEGEQRPELASAFNILEGPTPRG